MAVINTLRTAINRIRRKSRDSSPGSDIKPPLGPPPSQKEEEPANFQGPHIHPVELPLVLPPHRYNLAAQGWTTMTMYGAGPQEKSTRDAMQQLFSAGQTFFDRDDEYKSQFIVTEMGSEEGWNSIPGEKEFITIRSTKNLPSELRDAATHFWSHAGDLLIEMLGQIAKSLELNPEVLTRLAEPCARLGEERTATMLRLFRYEGWEDKVVAEPHCDLGLLSLVAGKSPGLEVWNSLDQSFYPIEKSYQDLSSAATVLGGRQLQRFTNGLYAPGGHQVRSYSEMTGKGKEPARKRYRYSIVFVLRAHYPVVIQANELVSRITGEPQMITDGMTVRDLFSQIKGAHYNINTGIQDREEQKRQLREKKETNPSVQELDPSMETPPANQPGASKDNEAK